MTKHTTTFELKDVNIKIPKGKLVFIIGRVGSGKSSLLYSIAGEMKVQKRNEAE